MMNATEFREYAQERSQAYWLLSRLFLKVPDAHHLRELHADLASVGDWGPLAELRREVGASLDMPDDAAVEFTRRLVVVSKASGENLPYESFVLEGTVPGQATAQVHACMGEAGFADIASDAPSPDHIGAELKFMALLCFEESQAWAASNPPEALQMIARQWRFLSGHLATWVPGYCEALEARSEHGYMKAVARLAKECVAADAAAIEDYFASVSNPPGGSFAAYARGSASVN